MAKIFKGESHINLKVYNHENHEFLERKFLNDFFDSLPIEELKKVVNFKEQVNNNEIIYSCSFFLDDNK
jgi:hypothetical protein